MVKIINPKYAKTDISDVHMNTDTQGDNALFTTCTVAGSPVLVSLLKWCILLVIASE